MFSFKILHQSKKSRARVGIISTPHGDIQTPGFVPVATNATMKSFNSLILDSLDIDLTFCNTYHLMLHPGAEVVAQAGGLHKFMNRTKPIITDSGGFQVFSLMYGGVANELKSKGTKSHRNTVLKINEEGVVFRSYRDGQKITLTPESSVQAQKQLGADIIIPLDELLPFHTSDKKLKKSFYRTHRWQERSFYTHSSNPNQQAMYGVVHGGMDSSLRKESCSLLNKFAFDGFAIGGSLGKTANDIFTILSAIDNCLPEDKPRHLLGIGDMPGVEHGVLQGVDTFDSSYPTKCARHGMLLSESGPIKIKQAQWKNFHEPISNAPIVKEYTAAYIHHLFKASEYVGHELAAIHNIWFMAEHMKKIRQNILDGKI